MAEKIVVVTELEPVRLTTPLGQCENTCIYVTLINGHLVLTGGSSIIERIEGEGMLEKVFESDP